MLERGFPREAWSLLAPGGDLARVAEAGLGDMGTAELTLAAGHFLGYLRSREGDVDYRGAAARVLAERGTPEQKDEALAFLVRSLAPGRPPRARSSRGSGRSGATPDGRGGPPSPCTTRNRPAHSRPLAGRSTHGVRAERRRAGRRDHSRRRGDRGPSGTPPRALGRGPRGETTPERSTRSSSRAGRRSSSASAERHPSSATRLAPTGHPGSTIRRLSFSGRAAPASGHEERRAELGVVFSDPRLWDRFWALAARDEWSLPPLVSLLPEDARTAWLSRWQTPSPGDGDPTLRARGESSSVRGSWSAGSSRAHPARRRIRSSGSCGARSWWARSSARIRVGAGRSGAVRGPPAISGASRRERPGTCWTRSSAPARAITKRPSSPWRRSAAAKPSGRVWRRRWPRPPATTTSPSPSSPTRRCGSACS